MTFLKGWWVLRESGKFTWLPLPSMVLKLAKLIRHPRELFPKDDMSTAYRKCAYALARSPGDVPPDYPILGPFIQCMLRLGAETDVELRHKAMRIPVGRCNSAVNQDSVLEQIATRYDICLEEILEFHQLLEEICELPVLLPKSPLLKKLMTDYL